MSQVAKLVTPNWSISGTDIALEGHGAVEPRGWDLDAIDDPPTFASALHETGLPPEDVADGLRLAAAGRDEVDDVVAAFWRSQDLRYLEAPEALLGVVEAERRFAVSRAAERLRDWFAGYRQSIDSRELVSAEMPLFVLAAAPSAGSTAKYESERARGRGINWTVDIAGTGMADHAVVKSSVTSGFEAKAGQRILVYLPVTIAVEQVRTSRADGTTVALRTRVNPLPDAGGQPAPGARLLDDGQGPGPGRAVASYDLVRYPAANLADYGFTYTQDRAASVTVGVSAFGVNLTAAGTVTLTDSVQIGYQLAGGRAYQLFAATGVDGLVWA